MAYSDLVDLDQSTVIETVPLNQVDFMVNNELENDSLAVRFGDTQINVGQNDKQFEVLCSAFGVPRPFAEKLPSIELLKDIFVTMANKEDAYNWAVDSFKGELAAYGEARKPYIPYSSVGQIFENAGMEDLQGFVGRNGIGEITGTHFHNALVEPRVGDITRSGLLYRGNPLNPVPPIILPYSYRLWCENGMSSREDKEPIKVTGHTVDDVLEQIEAQAERAFTMAERMNQHFADLVAHRVNPVVAMNNLLIAHKVPARLRENMMAEASALTEEFHTMYDILNIFTRYATGQHDPNRRLDMQVIGGDIAMSEHLNCNRCGSVLE